MSEAALSPLEVGTDYELFASEGGAAYVLRSKTDGLTARIQGDDAERFRNDYGAIKTRYPDWKPDQTLAQLWDQGGYSWLATAEVS